MMTQDTKGSQVITGRDIKEQQGTLACKATLHIARDSRTKFLSKDKITTQKQDKEYWACVLQLEAEEEEVLTQLLTSVS